MLYFKNVELAEKYHISLGTVRNWIEAAGIGKLDLILHTKDGKSYVANTASNIATIEQLVQERKKYRNTKAAKMLTPKKEFYELYTQEQIYDIVRSLEIYREIPRQYNYFDGGAGYWDKYMQRLDREKNSNYLTVTRQLLEKNASYIEDLIKSFERINVIDIGVGNAFPVKNFLERLLDQGKLGRYTAIDISPSMLAIAEQNIHMWFKGRIHFDSKLLDISREQFTSVVADSYIKNASKNTANLVLLLGGTLANFRKQDMPLRVINDSMGTNDFLILTQKLDTKESRQFFDFNFEPGKTSLSPNHRLIFDLLDINESFYDVQMGYDEILKERYIRARLKVSININFKFNSGEREIALAKGESILLLRVAQESPLDLLNKLHANDFYTLHSSQTEDRQYILTVSNVGKD